MEVLVSDARQAFFAARRPRKDSPHTTAAYQRDLAGIVGVLADEVGRSVEVLTVGDLTTSALRGAFGVFADGHARSSVSRAWSTWNQFLSFCVAEGLVAGNPMAAVARPRPAPCPPSRCGVRTRRSGCCRRWLLVLFLLLRRRGIRGRSGICW